MQKISVAVLLLGFWAAEPSRAQQNRFLRNSAQSRQRSRRDPQLNSRAQQPFEDQDRRDAIKTQAELKQAAAEFTGKIHRLGSWEGQNKWFGKTIDRLFKDNKLTNDSEQFFKRVLIETYKPRPEAMAERFNVFVDVIGERYDLDDVQKRKLRQLAISQTVVMAMKHGPKLVPVLRDVLDTRLAKKPVTAQQVAEWIKVVRPVAEDVYADSLKKLQPLLETLTPEQRQLADKDLAVLDNRVGEVNSIMKNVWEKGKWKAKHWAMEDDYVQSGKVASAAAKSKDPKLEPVVPGQQQNGANGPLRVGDTRGQQQGIGAQQQQEPPLPDESHWVSYVKQFCARYDLDRAQQASAYAILKDLQARAQTYRGSRSQLINRLQAEMRRTDSAEQRVAIQVELRGVLAGVDELFEELKSRLESIPTSGQLRRGG